MLKGAGLGLAKGMLLQWTETIYHQRGWLCVVGFGGGQAEVLQPPCKATAVNETWIKPIHGGGGSPVAKGLQLADKVIATFSRKSPPLITRLWLLTDARFTVFPNLPIQADLCGIVDFETASVPLDRAHQLAMDWQAEYMHVSDLL